MADEDFKILHLGDVHQKHALAADEPSWKERVRHVARFGPFDCIVATGDFGWAGNAESVEHGVKLVLDLRTRLSDIHKSLPALVIAPGNHDIQRPKPGEEGFSIDARFRQIAASVDGQPKVLHPLITDEERERGIIEGQNLLWDKEKGVVLFPLSSVDYSGTLLGEVHELAWQAAKRLAEEGRDGAADTLAKVIAQDVAWVSEQHLAIERFITTHHLRDDPDFLQAIRIAALHHPLFAVTQPGDVRTYPVVANGRDILHWLHHIHCHLVLHGHDHRLRFTTDWSSSSSTEPIAYGSRGGAMGLLAMSAGCFASGYGAPDDWGFVVVRVSPRNQRSGRTISAHISRFNPEHDGEDQTLVHTDMSGRVPRGVGQWAATRWIRHERDSTELALAPQHPIVHHLQSAVREVERILNSQIESFESRGEDPIAEFASQHAFVDRYVHSGLEDIRQYAFGTRGVTKDFIANLREKVKAPQTRAVVFVDTSGRSTWLQPDLAEHNAVLFRAYAARNPRLPSFATPSLWLEREGHPAPQSRRWMFAKQIEDRVMEGKALFGFPPPTRRAAPLRFDMTRVLFWTLDELLSVAGRTLVRMHLAYDVPLFWVDRAKWKRPRIGDFHVIWTRSVDSATSPSGGLLDLRGEESAQAFELDEDGHRKEIQDHDARESLKLHFLSLLDVAEPCPAALHDVFPAFEA